MSENAGTRMVAALEAAGFTVAGRGRGYTRMGWPGSDPMAGNLMVPTDDAAPEFGELLDRVKAQLLAGARRGEAARHALDLFHFTSRDKAEQWLRDHGWLIVGGRVLCEGCAARAECETTGHQWSDEWLTFNRRGVEWRERYCDHCSATEYDPPFEQLKVLSDAAQVLDGVRVDGDKQ